MERIHVLIYLLIIAAVLFLVIRYWKTGRRD
jgi:large-conductance mechanosensitive channel